MLRSLTLAGVLIAAGPVAALAQAAPAAAVARAPQKAVTQHAGRFNGQAVSYKAIVAEDFVPGAADAPAASIVTTAYVRTGVKNQAKRPVLFLFNGGPGASTTPLHFGAFGPYKREGEEGAQRMVDNPDSILDATDLVFIDPVGTGYSRPLAGFEGQPFWSRTGDAASVKQVMLDWLKANGREDSPRYMLGQSYGTTRAGMIAKAGDELKLDGILLFALVGDPKGLEMPYVTTLPTFAAVAWHHGRIDRAGRTVGQVYDQAVAFARTEYVTALIKGGSLPAEEKRALAEKMSALIGLPADFILAKDLRLSKDDFMRNLLKDKNLRTGMLDGRATRSLDAPPQRGPYDDPGLNYEAPRPPGPPSTGMLPASKMGLSPVDSYFKEFLKFRTAETYNALNLDVNSAWDYEDRSDSNRFIGEAMQRNPRLRLFWVSGYYDITTPSYGARYALDQAGVPGERLTAAAFAGGHSVFTDPANLTALSHAVREFVRPEGAAQ
jgi:carboxypeptidase C (cathepsin A)